MLFDGVSQQLHDIDAGETAEWMDAFDDVVEAHGRTRARYLLMRLLEQARAKNVDFPASVSTPYVNTIPTDREPEFPGDEHIERRIRAYIRWNAAVMVVRANARSASIGGHLSTYASSASLYEVGFNHFFHGKDNGSAGDQVYFQGHGSPGIYARAFVEGRLTEQQLDNFRFEVAGDGLSSYPHPRLMPDFWEFPTVSMGLGPLSAISQAHMNRYLHARGLADTSASRVWCFVGDGELDEPETIGGLGMAAREHLDNLTFVVNCNLQRLDGSVRGNGKVIQEFEALFRGAGWNVIKVIWGGDWDPLLARDTNGLLQKRMGEVVDGEFQTYVTKDGAYIRQHFFGKYPELLELVAHLSDEEIFKLRRGGHDPRKVFNAYQQALDTKGRPALILAHAVKGYGLGEAGEGSNISLQQKKLNEAEIAHFRSRFEIPIPDESARNASFYRPPSDSPEMSYLHERRRLLGGYMPSRKVPASSVVAPSLEYLKESLEGSAGREVSSTMAMVRVLTLLLKHPELGKRVVPIIPDEARTFGMESLFRQFGIYASQGQLYKPHDAEIFL